MQPCAVWHKLYACRNLATTRLSWELRATLSEHTIISVIVGGRGMQSYTPQLVSGPLGQDPPNKYAGALWAFLLAPITVAMACFLEFSPIFEKNGHDSQVMHF
jgi:hypothetical protein